MKLNLGNIIIQSALFHFWLLAILANEPASDPRVVTIQEDRGVLYRDGRQVELDDLKRIIRSGEFIRLDVEIGKAASEEGSEFLDDITKFCKVQNFELSLIYKESVYFPSRLKEEKISVYGMNLNDPRTEMPPRFSKSDSVNIAWNGESYKVFNLDDEVGEGSEIIAVKIDQGAWTLEFYAHFPTRVRRISLSERENGTISFEKEGGALIATISLK